ncbi:MAG: c-type cytochrome [Methyloglobulus sp.]|nr:c-type cytochrome [Methyloglobulus sp.]
MKNNRIKYPVLAFWMLAVSLVFSTADTFAAELEMLVETCGACHGKEGASSEPDVPNIGGESAEYLKVSLKEFKGKERPCVETKIRIGTKKDTKTDMCKVVADLSDDDLKQLIDYFSKQKTVHFKQPFDAALAEKGKAVHGKSCEKCHTEGGSLPSDDAAVLAGQKMDYLDTAFKDLVAGKRPMSKKMKVKIEALEAEDFDALKHFYGNSQ